MGRVPSPLGSGKQALGFRKQQGADAVQRAVLAAVAHHAVVRPRRDALMPVAFAPRSFPPVIPMTPPALLPLLFDGSEIEGSVVLWLH